MSDFKKNTKKVYSYDELHLCTAYLLNRLRIQKYIAIFIVAFISPIIAFSLLTQAEVWYNYLLTPLVMTFTFYVLDRTRDEFTLMLTKNKMKRRDW